MGSEEYRCCEQRHENGSYVQPIHDDLEPCHWCLGRSRLCISAPWLNWSLCSPMINFGSWQVGGCGRGRRAPSTGQAPAEAELPVIHVSQLVKVFQISQCQDDSSATPISSPPGLASAAAFLGSNDVSGPPPDAEAPALPEAVAPGSQDAPPVSGARAVPKKIDVPMSPPKLNEIPKPQELMPRASYKAESCATKLPELHDQASIPQTAKAVPPTLPKMPQLPSSTAVPNKDQLPSSKAVPASNQQQQPSGSATHPSSEDTNNKTEKEPKVSLANFKCQSPVFSVSILTGSEIQIQMLLPHPPLSLCCRY